MNLSVTSSSINPYDPSSDQDQGGIASKFQDMAQTCIGQAEQAEEQAAAEDSNADAVTALQRRLAAPRLHGHQGENFIDLGPVYNPSLGAEALAAADAGSRSTAPSGSTASTAGEGTTLDTLIGSLASMADIGSAGGVSTGTV